MTRRPLALLCAAALTLAAPAAAQAFDTGPHSDISLDAMTAEGFSRTAADVVSVNNWFVDLYSNASKVPHSGHASLGKELLAGALGSREHWDDDVVEAAVLSHFDSELDGLATTAGVQAEFERLQRTTGRLARSARDTRNPLALLTTIGMSLHELQDFYSHTNWIEPQGVAGVDGPNWATMRYGQTPTWFDVPAADRARLANIYAGGTPEHTRGHGGWNTDGNASATTGMNKDWPGRPGYANAHITAYFATRQWVQAIRAWVGDEAFWRSAQAYSQRHGGALGHDLFGATAIGFASGHWQGQGEPCNPQWSTNVCGDRNGPGGDLIDLRAATKAYFEARGRTPFRRMFERLVTGLAARNPSDPPFPVASSQDLQRATRFVRLRVLQMRGIDLGDIGPDDADMFARATIAGQSFLSGGIKSHDSYSFGRPNAPFEWLKSVPAGGSYAEPVTSMTVEIRTSSARFAGTDDDVHLNIGAHRFNLDKRLYDDFERGDRDTYSVPIDRAVRAGLTVGDVRRIAIEKSRDGVAGGWKLRGVTVRVNGRVIYARDGIERWLEDDHRTWTAPDFRPADPRGTALGVTLDLYDQDAAIYGSNDHGDLEPLGHRKTLALGYRPGSIVERRTTGGSTFSGRLGDGDKATVRYRVETIVPVAATPAPAPPPVVDAPPVAVDPPAPKPDLVITAMDWNPTDQWFVTVKNQGAAAAGPFTLDVAGFEAFAVPGLAAGASTTISYTSSCVTGTRTATADSTAAVAESDETNNTRSFTQDLCVS